VSSSCGCPGSADSTCSASSPGSDAALPIIFLTGHGDIPMSVRAMKAGAVEFLTKPFRELDLSTPSWSASSHRASPCGVTPPT
jgi:FixJ family two-component response regulator